MADEVQGDVVTGNTPARPRDWILIEKKIKNTNANSLFGKKKDRVCMCVATIRHKT